MKELYAELAVPLLEERPFVKSLGLQLAARRTDYSSSGGVSTWKVGGTWDVTDSIRLRATQSRDIRAGNLGELFTPTAVSLVSIFNPGTSSINTPVQVTTSGNPVRRAIWLNVSAGRSAVKAVSTWVARRITGPVSPRPRRTGSTEGPCPGSPGTLTWVSTAEA